MDVIIRCLDCTRAIQEGNEDRGTVEDFYSLSSAVEHIMRTHYQHEVVIEVREPESND